MIFMIHRPPPSTYVFHFSSLTFGKYAYIIALHNPLPQALIVQGQVAKHTLT